MKFYTMLHIGDGQNALGENGLSGDFNQQLFTYAKCCEKLSESFKKNGFNLTVLTNNEDILKKICPSLDTLVIPFKLNVPKGIRFFSAHHTVDVFKWLSETADEYSVLIDNDVICINDIPQNLVNLVRADIPTYYDITDQVYPAFGRQRIIDDKSKLGITNGMGMWAGGEYIGGDKSFYFKLYYEISKIVDKYFEIAQELHKQGNEVLLSVALEKMIYNGSPIIDIGKFGAIGRFWSGETLHCQRLFQSFKDYFLLHLPGDKDYISNIPSVENLYEKYAEYLERKGIVISPKMHDLKNNSRFRNLLISMGLIKSFSD